MTKTLNEKWSMDEITAFAEIVAEERNLKLVKKSGCWIQLLKEKCHTAEFEFTRFPNGVVTFEHRGHKMTKVPMTGEAWKNEKKRLKELNSN